MISGMKDKPEKEWTHAGFKCHIMKCIFNSGNFHRCGYVTIPEDHICYNMGHDDIPIDVHGGLTYGTKDTFGFDTGHAGDRGSEEVDRQGHFWLLGEVVKETNKMAKQLSKITMTEVMERKLEYMPKWFTDNIKIKESK